MNHVEWDPETGGVRLTRDQTQARIGVPPRPVFYEELDLLGLYREPFLWTYPHCAEPLLWACNKQYFYRGRPAFSVRGANLYNTATVTLAAGMTALALEPVDVRCMLERTNDAMFLLESEAIDFIRDTYDAYAANSRTMKAPDTDGIDYEALAQRAEKRKRQKMAVVRQDCDSFDIVPLDVAKRDGRRVLQTTKRIDIFLASFSGGKDSQVVLDLCTRALDPQAFRVIYSDTGYELPSSLTLYEQVKRHYHALYPTLRFDTARNHDTVLHYWDEIGTPSDTHRWCCSVMKTAPLYRMLKADTPQGQKQAHVLTFDGVRAEESVSRSTYGRLGKGKHQNIINAHPILHWNTTEIFLYHFLHNLLINQAYRSGKARVGCVICPFASTWDDMISARTCPDELQPFTDRITSWASQRGIGDIAEYVKERKWNLITLGRPTQRRANVQFFTSHAAFTARVQYARSDIYRWLPALCDFEVERHEGVDIGQLRYKADIVTYRIDYHSANDYTLTISQCVDIELERLLRRVVNKSAFCINCEVCEADCPSGALTILPEVNINNNVCTHCHKCLNSHDRGCVVADCIRMVEDSNKKAQAKVQSYKSFGLREQWLNNYLSSPDDYWTTNNLARPMLDSFRAWLRDAELLDIKGNITPFGQAAIRIHKTNPSLVWELVFVNLAHNSFMVRWFVRHIAIGGAYSKKQITDQVVAVATGVSPATVSHAAGALLGLLKSSPVGTAMGNYHTIDRTTAQRRQNQSASTPAVLYALYKYADRQGTRNLRVADFDGTDTDYNPISILGIDKEQFLTALRSLSTASDRMLVAELQMGLDHITLRDDITAVSLLDTL